MRVAIYARYSDDKQSPHSIEDQVRLCREHVGRAGLGEVVEVYSDAAISGASLITRPGAKRLLSDARTGRFDAVLIESLDRISRDQEDIAAIKKRLAFADVALIAVDDGAITELHVGLKGTMAALYLKDVAAKTRRGQIGRAVAGFSPGGLSYGYRVVRRYDERGEPIRGMREIDPDQAAVIKRIYRRYLAGDTPRTIAAALNRDRVPGPRGGEWGASTIAGGKGRKTGILWNPAYIGQIIYNRTTFRKDPDTGKRLSRPNSGDRVIATNAPHLRIISDRVWEAAQALHASRAQLPLHQQPRRPKHAFSGLVRCATCGASFTMRQPGRLGCSRRYERSTCDNHSTITVAALERRVIAGLTDRLLAPDAMRLYVTEYHRERERIAAEKQAATAALARRLMEIDQELDRFVDAIGKGTASVERVNDRMASLERERAEILAIGVGGGGKVVSMHPRLLERYESRIAELCAAVVAGPAQRLAALTAFREFVDRIEVGVAEAPRRPPPVIVHGLLFQVLSYATSTGSARERCEVSVGSGGGICAETSLPALRIAC